MTKVITIMVTFLLLEISAFADGFIPMELKQVLLETDTIILVEIIENKQTIKHENKGEGNAPPIRLEDGHWVRLGNKYELDIVRKEMYLRYDSK